MNIRQARKHAGLTQKQLAKAINCSSQNIYRLENGTFEPRLSTLRKIAKACGVKLEDILDSNFAEDCNIESTNTFIAAMQPFVNNDFKTMLTDARIGCGLSQQELADRLGVSVSAVNKMEKQEDRGRVETLVEYAKAFMLRVEEIEKGTIENETVRD